MAECKCAAKCLTWSETNAAISSVSLGTTNHLVHHAESCPAFALYSSKHVTANYTALARLTGASLAVVLAACVLAF